MLIVNSDEIGLKEEEFFKCNSGLIAVHLMYISHIEPIGKSRDGMTWYFKRTSELEIALRDMPFWMKI